jgi:hypothetical protein
MLLTELPKTNERAECNGEGGGVHCIRSGATVCWRKGLKMFQLRFGDLL